MARRAEPVRDESVERCIQALKARSAERTGVQLRAPERVCEHRSRATDKPVSCNALKRLVGRRGAAYSAMCFCLLFCFSQKWFQ
jgi:hypothetical protein